VLNLLDAREDKRGAIDLINGVASETEMTITFTYKILWPGPLSGETAKVE
jgi:hypothetical protein